MEKFVNHTGTSVAIDLANIDTDQIIPKQFLKRIERTGYGEFLFFDWRFSPKGEVIADFPLNDASRQNASVLISGDNFGCGSSREHAPWSLLDYGFRVIVAPSFADIFYNNSLNTGLLPVILDASDVAALMEAAKDPAYELTVDLESQTISDQNGFTAEFPIDAFRKFRMLNGLDDIGLTLQNERHIGEYEDRIAAGRSFLAFPA